MFCRCSGAFESGWSIKHYILTYHKLQCSSVSHMNISHTTINISRTTRNTSHTTTMNVLRTETVFRSDDNEHVDAHCPVL